MLIVQGIVYNGGIMIKKITAFFVAFFIFTYTLTYCFYHPVFATVPVETDFSLLNDAIATLYFMTGLGYNTDSSHDDEWWFEYADAQTVAIWQNEQAAKKQRLDDAWEEFKDSVKRGYGIAFHLNEELYEELQNYAYYQEVAISGIYQNMSQNMRNYYAQSTGNVLVIRNESNYGIATFRFGNLVPSFPLTPVKTYPTIPSNNQYHVVIYNYTGTPYSMQWAFSSPSWDPQTRTGIDYSLQIGLSGTTCDYAYIPNKVASTFSSNSLVNSYITSGQYTDIIDDVYGVDANGDVIIDSTGDLPNVIGRSTLGGYSDAIDAGETTWGDILGSMAVSEPAEPSIPAPDGSLTIDQLDSLVQDLHLERLQNKFPFCIPHDLQLIFTGAAAVSSNAPVITIPMHLEFNNVVYYDNPECVTIDFNDFLPVVTVFREGFFLLFLLGMIWLSIQIMQAFFVVTE